MHTALLDLLICPSCLPAQRPLEGYVDSRQGTEILEGCLECRACGKQYPIQNGLAFLLVAETEHGLGKYGQPEVISSYLWSHFGDYMGDDSAAGGYREWTSMLPSNTGLALDAGCAVGRMCLEMSKGAELAIGVDNSPAFVQTARELCRRGGLEFDLVVEGTITEKKHIRLPMDFQKENTEFLVADCLRLPFPKSVFSLVTSLNMVDKVVEPLRHLQEVNRVARESSSRLLLSDPFSWSREVAGEEKWLGGSMKGRFAGRSADVIRSLLQGRDKLIYPAWEIESEVDVDWVIRNHANHRECITSHCFVAKR